MWLFKLSLLLLVGASLAQLDDDRGNSPTIRRLRFRKQRPKLASINNENGVQEGVPIPLRNAGVPVDQLLAQQEQRPDTASLLAAAFVDEPEPRRPRPGQSLQSTDALESLFATANRDEVPEEVLLEEVQEEPVAPVRQRPGGRTRRPPGVPRRTQVRARPAQIEADTPRRLPATEERDEPIKTIERYSHQNEDGSFTFGYMAEDGSFREETRGVDCITRGKYGYVDPDGKRREFTYVSGLPCEITGEESEDEEGLQQIDDPIAPSERFKSSSTQLTDDEAAQFVRQRQRQPVRRPAQVVDDESSAAGNDFSSFRQQQRPRVRDPATQRRPVGGRPRPSSGDDSALQNLLTIADNNQNAVQPTPLPVRARPTPTRARPTPTRPGNFNFDSEIDSLAVNPRRPALTFEGEQPRQQAGAPTPVGPSFTSELVFDPSSGTFKTELRQNVGGGAAINLRNEAAPGARPNPTQPTQRPVTPTPFAPTQRPVTPTQRPFTAFSPTPARPAGSTGGSSITFEPLSFPDPSTIVTQRPATPSPSPSPIPTRPATPVPTRPPTPPPTPRAPPTPTQPANSFFFQPLPTVGSPRPVAPGQPATPRPVAQPTSVFPAGTFTLGAQPTPQAARPTPQAARPAPPQPIRPAQPQPVRSAVPQVQFGFQPITAQPQAGRPFTAFSAGTPPQLNGAPAPQPQFQARPPQAFQARPPNPQQAFQAFPTQQRPPLGIPPQLQQQGARFSPFGRPGARPPPPSSPFTVFNPAAIRGA